MKKTLSILLVLAMLMSIMSISVADEALTHFTGKVGFSVDYPADMLDVYAYGLNTTFVCKPEDEIMILTVLPSEEPDVIPTVRLLSYAAEYDHAYTESDVTELTAASGAKIWRVSFPTLDCTVISYVVQDGGRQFTFDYYSKTDLLEKYAEAAEKIVLSFVNEPDGDMSGYAEEEEIEWEPDYYDGLLERYEDGIDLYAAAIAERWDAERLLSEDMSLLTALMDEDTIGSVYFSFVDMNPNRSELLSICVPAGEDGKEAEVIALATSDEDGKIRFLATSGERDSYVLCGNAQDGYTLAEFASCSASQSAVFFWRLNDAGELELADGVLYDYSVDEKNPCFLVKDTDFDASKGTPCTEEEAQAVISKYIPAKDVEETFSVLIQDYLSYLEPETVAE